jgi:hypothetical protein
MTANDDKAEKKKNSTDRWWCVLFFALGLLMLLRVAFSRLPLDAFYSGGSASAPKVGPATGWQLLLCGLLLCGASAYGYIKTKRKEDA